jgi:hypothetical protein
MIKFFRKIRQNLLMENKTGKYFKYAIGEILLVVVGILIALQINNWNENKKKAELGYQYLTEMRNELERDANYLDKRINELEEDINKQEAALNTKDISKLPLDSLTMIISNTNLDFKTSELTYNKMVNLGITKLTNNDSLNLQITEYYNRYVVNLKSGMNFIFNDLVKRIDYELYEQNKIDFVGLYSNYKFPSLYKQTEVEYQRELKSNIVDFIYSVKGRNLVLYDFSGKRYSLKLLKRFQQKTINLLKEVYNELKVYDPKIKPLSILPEEIE